jgi:hypothetical protein
MVGQKQEQRTRSGGWVVVKRDRGKDRLARAIDAQGLVFQARDPLSVGINVSGATCRIRCSTPMSAAASEPVGEWNVEKK